MSGFGLTRIREPPAIDPDRQIAIGQIAEPEMASGVGCLFRVKPGDDLRTSLLGRGVCAEGFYIRQAGEPARYQSIFGSL